MTQNELAYAHSPIGDGNRAIALLKATFRDPTAFGFQSVAVLRAESRWDHRNLSNLTPSNCSDPVELLSEVQRVSRLRPRFDCKTSIS